MRRWIGRTTLLLAMLLLMVTLAAWWLLRGSLPRLDGEAGLPGLSAPASIERDALGVVTIDAASRADAMRALGFVHAQERYFEMDLMRRTSAGELAALFGPRALAHDRGKRVHRMRARVLAGLDDILGEQRADVVAYVAGVNTGIESLDKRPWPYLLLRANPEPWQLADSPLVGLAMYFDLQDEHNARELGLWRIRPHLPPALFELITHDGSSWDAPLQGEARGDAVLPRSETLDLRGLPAPIRQAATAVAPFTPPLPSRVVPPSSAERERGIGEPAPATEFQRGSNNFAVAGALTDDGRAIVADDMHLGLRAPNIWFRVRLRYPDPRAPGGRVDVTGFSLPGLPGVVVGSNGHVAWGFTNSYGDWADWRREPGCAGECTIAVTHRERILVAGAEPVELDVRETRWGPLLHETDDGDGLALRWAAHLPGALDFGLMDFAHAGSLDALFKLADRAAIPAQNLVAGDRTGRIGWRLLGPMAERTAGCVRDHLVEDAAPGSSPSLARPTASGANPVRDLPCPPWSLVNGNNPQIPDPPGHRLWTANARVVDGGALEAIGDGGYVLGVRGWMIRDRLSVGDIFNETDLLAIQLDDRSLFLERWWRLLREQAAASGTPALRGLADADPHWPARAAGETASYRIVRAWRLAVHARIAAGLLAPARAALGEDVPMPSLPQLEGVAWPLVTQRPPHLLPTAHACAARAPGDPACRDDEGWLALFEDAAREVREELAARGPLPERTWAERNTAAICHPLAAAVPLVGRRLLCMPREPLAGDTLTPRVQSPSAGASQRMVVSPGHESRGFAHMPGGQSGHPLSPFWGAGHDDWVHGRPTPFLPGKAQHRLRLIPAEGNP